MANGLKRPLKSGILLIDGNNPIVNGLVFDAVLNRNTFDTINKLKGAITGTPSWNNDLYGQNLTFAGATDVVAYTPPSNAKMQSMTHFTYEALINMTGTGGGATGYIVCKSNAGPPYFLLSVKTSSTLQILTGYATTQGSWTIPITQNLWNHIVVCANIDTTTTPLAWVNGIPQTVTVSSSPSGTAPSDTTNLYIGNNSGGTRNWAGQIAYVRAWNRWLTQPEVSDLNANPWCIYRMQNGSI